MFSGSPYGDPRFHEFVGGLPYIRTVGLTPLDRQTGIAGGFRVFVFPENLRPQQRLPHKREFFSQG